MACNRIAVFSLFAFLAALAIFSASCDCSDPLMGSSAGGGSGSTGQGDGSMTADGAGCGDHKPLLNWPMSGYLLEFKDAHEFFRVWVSADATDAIAHVTNWLAAPSWETLGVPGGVIEMVNTFNPGYSYSLKPGTVVFKPAGTIGVDAPGAWPEDCDAAPCYVEDDRFAWIKDPMNWCPWGAVVQNVWDCRGGAVDGPSCGDPVFTLNP